LKSNGKKPDKRAALKMTLRQAFEAFYPKDELSDRTIDLMHDCLARWERFVPANPPIAKITDDMLEEFRKAALVKLAPVSVNGSRRTFRAIFRRVGPPVTGNPTGLGILPRIPYMRPTREIRGLPRRVSQEDLSRFYIACGQIQSPKTGFPAPRFWQTLLVVLYFSGLRRGDVFNIKFADLDLDGGTLLFTARKTAKPMRLPLHPCVVEHVRRIVEPKREYLFQSSIKISGDLHRRWNWICRKAGVEKFTPHDLRRTCCAESERIKAGMGSVILQHAVNDTTHVSYLNQMEELAETIEKMRVPLAFKHGPKQAERQLAIQKERAQQMMRVAQFAPPSFPSPAEWQFHKVGFVFRGHHVRMEGAARRIVEALALSPRHNCTLEELKAAVWPDGPVGSSRTVAGRISDAISTIRERLRHVLLLPPAFNPVPCVERGAPTNGRWTLYIPGSAGPV
jgi:integrase